MGDAVTGINRADSASGELNWVDAAPTSCVLQQQWVSRYFRDGGLAEGLRRGCQHCGQRATQSSRQATYPPPRESCVRGADRAAVDKRFRAFLVGRRLCAGVESAVPDGWIERAGDVIAQGPLPHGRRQALPGKVLRRCRAVAAAMGVGDPPKGGCMGPRALRSCTIPDSPCPARASQRHSPDREGALRWRPGLLRAPPPRADHAIPPGAAARGQRHRAHRSQYRK